MNTTTPTDRATEPGADRAAAQESAARAAHRITALDSLRGFALCGILLVNLPYQLMEMAKRDDDLNLHPVPAFLDSFVHQRFFPVFAFLFGLSFALFLDSAARRSSRPRLLLVRRLVVLGLLGLAHQQLQPGEALLPYAVFGLLILLPASWLPTWVVLPAGLLGLVASVTLAGGGSATNPGLLLLGLAVARLGVARTLDRRTRQLAVVLVLAAVGTVAVSWWERGYPSAGPYATRIAAAAGLLGAAAYATGLLLVLRTRLGRPLSAVLEPLGRMALTNYLTATLVVLAAAGPLDLRYSSRWVTAMALAAAVLTAQTLFSRWWLARFRYGPLEWVLRCLTWWNVVPLRRSHP
ncbi:DUF418 domain-containing protein [Streptomyces niveus]|uniref:DUF418 domain-containing protein n=1 Tax=Streptomyces niveus TaxID=193462 RepID=UPI002E35C222|nr:DUF418 domain-containing protein [Streptomyces niveus]WTA61217.1 DUF418 domain-containing protein [Streptomyces niveus]